jgi:hypothetical protein
MFQMGLCRDADQLPNVPTKKHHRPTKTDKQETKEKHRQNKTRKIRLSNKKEEKKKILGYNFYTRFIFLIFSSSLCLAPRAQ